MLHRADADLSSTASRRLDAALGPLACMLRRSQRCRIIATTILSFKSGSYVRPPGTPRHAAFLGTHWLGCQKASYAAANCFGQLQLVRRTSQFELFFRVGDEGRFYQR